MDYVVVGIHVVWLGLCLSIERFWSRNLSRARTTWPNDLRTTHHSIARSPQLPRRDDLCLNCNKTPMKGA